MDGENRTVIVGLEKRGKDRIVPMHPLLGNILDRHLEARRHWQDRRRSIRFRPPRPLLQRQRATEGFRQTRADHQDSLRPILA
jgi:integrase